MATKTLKQLNMVVSAVGMVLLLGSCAVTLQHPHHHRHPHRHRIVIVAEQPNPIRQNNDSLNIQACLAAIEPNSHGDTE